MIARESIKLQKLKYSMIKFVLTQENLSVLPFTQFVNEGIESGSDLNRSESGKMLRQYPADNDIVKIMRDKIALSNNSKKSSATIYPCYRVNRNEKEAFVFYDNTMERTFELFKPINKSKWMIKLGEKNPKPDSSNEQQVKTAQSLRDNFKAAYELWENKVIAENKLNFEGKKIGGYTLTDMVIKEPAAWDALVFAVGRVRQKDLLANTKTDMFMEDELGKTVTYGGNYSKVEQGMGAKREFERSLTGIAHKDWYSKHIGDIGGMNTFIARDKKSSEFGREKIADAIMSMGLNTEEGTSDLTNTELLQIFNNLIQNNPFAADSTKQKWINILQSLYERFYIIGNTEAVGRRYDMNGAELYDENVKGVYNNAKNSREVRIMLFKLLNNFILASEGHYSPKGSNTERIKDNKYAQEKSYESLDLQIPTFATFMTESARTETFHVVFDKPVTKAQLDAIKGVVSVTPIHVENNSWEITGTYDHYIKNDVYQFALDNGLQVLAFVEKDTAVEQPSGTAIDEFQYMSNTQKRKIEEQFVKKALGKTNARAINAHEIRALMQAKEKTAKSLKQGVYLLDRTSQETGTDTYKEFIFDSTNLLGGYVVIKYNKNAGQSRKYSGSLILNPKGISNYISPLMLKAFILKSEGGYVCYGVPDSSTDTKVSGQVYYESPRAYNNTTCFIKKDILNFENEDDAYDAVQKIKKDSGIDCTPVTIGEAINLELTQDYNEVQMRFRENTGNPFFIDPEDATQAIKLPGRDNANARSAEVLSADTSVYRSFLDAIQSVFNKKKVYVATMAAIEKSMPLKVSKAVSSRNYSSVEREISPEIAGEIKSMGHDASVAKNSTLSDYLVKSAQMIASIKSKVSNETHDMLVSDWQRIADMVMEMSGSSLKSNDKTEISNDEIKQVQDSLANDSAIKDNDKVGYITAKAYLQMFVREIGSALINYSMSKPPVKIETDSFLSDVEKCLDVKYVQENTFADIWFKYMTTLNSADTNVPEFKNAIDKLRQSLLDKAELIIDNADVDQEAVDAIEKMNASTPLSEDETDLIRTALYKVDRMILQKGTSSQMMVNSKNQLYQTMKKLYDEYMIQKTTKAL